MTLRSILKANFKPFYCIWYGQRKDTWIKTRYCCSALAGTVSTWLVCKCIFKSVLIPKNYENLIILLTISIVAGAFLFTDAVKCVTFLLFLSLFGKSGRSYIRALAFAFVISGPIENLSSNTGEIISTFSCYKVLAINLTRTRLDLMIKPFQNSLLHMKEDIRDVQNTFNQLGNVTKDLHKEVMLEKKDENLKASSVEDTFTAAYSNYQKLNEKDIEERYKKKFNRRCLKQLDSGKVRCKNAFSNAFKICYDKMPFILKTITCWPFKVDFICQANILGDPEKICNASDAIPSNFAKSYVELVATESKLYKESSSVKVNYTILNSEASSGIKKAEKAAKNVANEFKVKKKVFDLILRTLQQFLGFMVLKILYGTYDYIYTRYTKRTKQSSVF